LFFGHTPEITESIVQPSLRLTESRTNARSALGKPFGDHCHGSAVDGVLDTVKGDIELLEKSQILRSPN
jgi:hypothetical protein